MRILFAGSFTRETRKLLEGIATKRGHIVLSVESLESIPKGVEMVFILAYEWQVALVENLRGEAKILAIDPNLSSVSRVIKFFEAGVANIVQLPYGEKDASIFFRDIECL